LGEETVKQAKVPVRYFDDSDDGFFSPGPLGNFTPGRRLALFQQFMDLCALSGRKLTNEPNARV